MYPRQRKCPQSGLAELIQVLGVIDSLILFRLQAEIALCITKSNPKFRWGLANLCVFRRPLPFITEGKVSETYDELLLGLRHVLQDESQDLVCLHPIQQKQTRTAASGRVNQSWTKLTTCGQERRYHDPGLTAARRVFQCFCGFETKGERCERWQKTWGPPGVHGCEIQRPARPVHPISDASPPKMWPTHEVVLELFRDLGHLVLGEEDFGGGQLLQPDLFGRQILLQGRDLSVGVGVAGLALKMLDLCVSASVGEMGGYCKIERQVCTRVMIGSMWSCQLTPVEHVNLPLDLDHLLLGLRDLMIKLCQSLRVVGILVLILVGPVQLRLAPGLGPQFARLGEFVQDFAQLAGVKRKQVQTQRNARGGVRHNDRSETLTAANAQFSLSSLTAQTDA